MIYENVEFHVRHENLGNVDTSFAATRPLLLASAKCQTAELFQSVNKPGSYLLRLGWEKAEDRPGTFPGRVPATVFTQMVTTYDMSPLRQSVPGPDQQAAESSGNDTIRIMPSANGEETWGAPALSRVREVLISLGEGHLRSNRSRELQIFLPPTCPLRFYPQQSHRERGGPCRQLLAQLAFDDNSHRSLPSFYTAEIASGPRSVSSHFTTNAHTQPQNARARRPYRTRCYRRRT